MLNQRRYDLPIKYFISPYGDRGGKEVDSATEQTNAQVKDNQSKQFWPPELIVSIGIVIASALVAICFYYKKRANDNDWGGRLDCAFEKDQSCLRSSEFDGQKNEASTVAAYSYFRVLFCLLRIEVRFHTCLLFPYRLPVIRSLYGLPLY